MILRLLLICAFTAVLLAGGNKFLENPTLEQLAFKKNYTEDVLKIRDAFKNGNEFNHSAYNRIAKFSDDFGPRLWGSKNLELAIADVYKQMVEEDFDNPTLQFISNVSHWVRGRESLTLYSPRPTPSNIPLIGLGLTVGGNVTAEVIVVDSFDDLEARRTFIPGKIVCFNAKWVSYRQTVVYRRNGPSMAAKYGAKAVLLRSIAPISIESPHTGALTYDPNYPQIPAAAVSLETADMFARMQARGEKIVVNLYLEGHYEDTVTTHNVIGEIRGSEFPEQILLMGGHIDSWDTGPQTGANDDAGGFFVCFEAVRTLIKLGLRPKRTIRFIAWSGEEMGLPMNGAAEYAKYYEKELENHIVALENDEGNTRPYGFGFSGGKNGLSLVQSVATNFLSILNTSFIGENNGVTTDNTPLYNTGIPAMKNLIDNGVTDDYYFTYHHSAGDSVNVLDPELVDQNVISLASLFYILADMEITLPRD